MQSSLKRALAGCLLTFALAVPVQTAAAHAETAERTRTPEPVPVAGLPGTVTRNAVATDQSNSGATCGDYNFPVTLSEDDPTVYQVWGRLCSRGPFTNRTVQVLIHGGSYNHNYWDWPKQPARYSYVAQATALGFTTLTIDRIGSGYSDHPPADVVTFDAHAQVTHQVVQYLKQGAFGIEYDKVVLSGHSMGGYTAMTEAGRYHDVDGVIISGAPHFGNPDIAEDFPNSLHPVQLDPKFVDANLPPGYLTTLPNHRCDFFYQMEFADPAVCALDDELKDVITTGELASINQLIGDPAPENSIDVPMLNALGDYDRIMCQHKCSDPDSPFPTEASVYPQADYEPYIQPRSGHDNNLHYSAPIWFAKASAWTLQHVGL